MLNSITQVRLPNGSTVNLVDWTDRPLFSTCDILDGGTDQELETFTYVVSERVPSTNNIGTRRTATERDTNISTASAMSSTEEMLVYSIRVEAYEYRVDGTNTDDATTAAADQAGLPIIQPQNLAELHTRSLLRLFVSQKIYAEAPVAYFNTGFGVLTSGGSSDTANAERYFGTAGLPSAEAVRTFVIPQHIGAQEKYKCVLFNPDGTAYTFRDGAGVEQTRTLIRVRVMLDGLYKRPVS